MLENDLVVRLLDEPNPGTVATVSPSGAPQLTIVWVISDGDDVLFTTRTTSRKVANMNLNPHVAILIRDEEDPGIYVELRGTVALTTGGGEVLDRILRKYGDGVSTHNSDSPDRTVVRLNVDSVFVREP